MAMKILGADGLKGTNVSLDAIPAGHVKQGDMAMAKYNNLAHFYELDEGHGGPESIPDVIIPAVDPNNKAWVLIGVYQTDITALDIFANSLSQASSGTPLDINGAFTVDGNVVSFTNVFTSPFEVSSQQLVNNLNAEFINGMSIDDILNNASIVTKIEPIYLGHDQITITLDEPRFDNLYSLHTEIINLNDTSPSLIQHIVTEKTLTGFTVKFSTTVDTTNYRLQYTIFGENIDYDSFNLLDVDSNPITDVDNNQFTII